MTILRSCFEKNYVSFESLKVETFFRSAYFCKLAASLERKDTKKSLLVDKDEDKLGR